MTVAAIQRSSVSALNLRTQYYPPYYPPYHPGHPPYGDPYGTDSYITVTSVLSAGAGAGVATYKLGAQMGNHIKGSFGNGFPGFFNGMKNVALTGFKGMGISALVGAGVSVVGNGIGVATGKIDSSEAAANVVGDTISSAVGGLGAVTLGGLGYLAFAKMGMAGTPLTVATVALGVIGGAAAGYAKDMLTRY